MRQDIILLNQMFETVNPLILGWERCDKRHAFGPASREYYLIHYIVSGKGQFINKNQRYALSGGDMFIIHPHEINFYQADSEDSWTYIWVGFELSHQGGMATQAAFLEKDVLYSQPCENIFKSMLECDRLKSAKELYVCAKLYELFSFLMEAHSKPESSNIVETYVAKALNYIETNYINDISVEGISKYLGINRSYFCSIFKKQTHYSPRQYIVNLRLTKAACLIAENGYTPAQAAISTGYGDIFNFSKMFKRKFGVSPLNYKRNTLKTVKSKDS